MMVANLMKTDEATTLPHKQIIEIFLTCVENLEVCSLTSGLLPISNYCIFFFILCCIKFILATDAQLEKYA